MSMPTARSLAAAFAVMAGLFLGAARSDAATTYFLVAERPGQEFHHDSFVLPLTESDDISHARDLISRGPDTVGSSIAFAKIAAGSDGINRDLLARDQHEWSWHVTEFEGFGDVGIELVDGTPTLVEDDVPGWLQNTNSSIGFWNYTVVRELPNYPAVIPPPPANAVPLPAAFPAAALTLLGTLVARRYVLRKTNKDKE
jgi:hypothetical protein